MTTMTTAVTIPAQHADLTTTDITIEALTGTVHTDQATSVFYLVDFVYRSTPLVRIPGYTRLPLAWRQAVGELEDASVLVELDHEVTTDAQRKALRVDLIATFNLDEDAWIWGLRRMDQGEVPWSDLIAVDEARELERAQRSWRGLAGVALRHLGVSR
jgi:hypothetical protein